MDLYVFDRREIKMKDSCLNVLMEKCLQGVDFGFRCDLFLRSSQENIFYSLWNAKSKLKGNFNGALISGRA